MPRIMHCLKAWGAGIGILCFPVILIYHDLVEEGDSWKTLTVLLFSYIPVLLFFELLVKKYMRNVFHWQVFSLCCLFILLEFAQNSVLRGKMNNQFTIGVIAILGIMISIVLAAIVISFLSRGNNSPVIIQIDI